MINKGKRIKYINLIGNKINFDISFKKILELINCFFINQIKILKSSMNFELEF